MSAIGCHAQHLASHRVGLDVARVVADAGALVPGRKVVDYVSALLEFDGGARGTFTATQAAAGGENDILLRIYGDQGMLEWRHRDPSYLRVALQGEPARVVGRGDAFLPPEIIAPGARRAAIRKVCARPSPTSTRKPRRSGWRAHWASPRPPFPIRASRKARTRWRSSRRAWPRRHRAGGKTWPGCRSEPVRRGTAVLAAARRPATLRRSVPGLQGGDPPPCNPAAAARFAIMRTGLHGCMRLPRAMRVRPETRQRTGPR